MSDIFEDFFAGSTAPADTAPANVLDKKAAFKILDLVVPKRASLPILKHVHIVGDGETLTITATDLDVGARVRIEYLDFHGSVVLPWKEFKAQIGIVPLAQIVTTFGPEDFPLLPEVAGDEVGDTWIPEAKKVVYAVLNNPGRFPLKGVYVHFRGVVATDGHLLHFIPGEHDFQAIVPPRILKMHLPGHTKILLKTCVTIVYPWGTLVSKVIDAPYPQYQRVIPDLKGYRVALIPAQLLNELCRKAVDWRKREPRIVFKDKAIWLEDSTSRLHKSTDLKDLPADFHVEFAPDQLLKSLAGAAVTGGCVEIGVHEPKRACLVDPYNTKETRIIMPLNPLKPKEE